MALVWKIRSLLLYVNHQKMDYISNGLAISNEKLRETTLENLEHQRNFKWGWGRWGLDDARSIDPS